MIKVLCHSKNDKQTAVPPQPPPGSPSVWDKVTWLDMPLATQHQWSRWCIATTSTSCPQAGLDAWGHGPLVLNKFWPVNLEVSCTFSHLILGLGDLKDLEKRNWVGNALTPWGWKFVHTKNKLHTHTQYPSHTVWAMTKTSTNQKVISENNHATTLQKKSTC